MITRDQSEEFFIRSIFGSGDDYLYLCIRRAYRDFNRTLHGVAKHATGSDLYQSACQLIRSRFIDLLEDKTVIKNQEEFDKWHRIICNQLRELYLVHSQPFYFGQAQKWVNMTFKYIYVLGESRISGISKYYALCHVPLDSIIMHSIKPIGFPGFGKPWARLDDYDIYLQCQKWIRITYDRAPLDVEFDLWMNWTLHHSD